MESIANLSALERKVFTSFHEDGIVDIFIGLLLAVDGLLMLSGHPAFVGVAVVILFLIPPAKKLITVPRIGMVKFSSSRNLRMMRVYLFLVISGLLVFMVFVLRDPSESLFRWLKEYYDLVLGVMFSVMAGIGAMLTGLKRYVGYMVGVLFLFVAGHFFIWEFPVTLACTGGMLLITGMITLVRFLKKYPVSDMPEEIRP